MFKVKQKYKAKVSSDAVNETINIITNVAVLLTIS